MNAILMSALLPLTPLCLWAGQAFCAEAPEPGASGEAKAAAPAEKVRILCVPGTSSLLKDFARSLSLSAGARVSLETADAAQIEKELSAGQASLAVSDRIILPSGAASKEVRNIPFASKGLLFAASPENPSVGLSMAQIKKIMDGEIMDWSQLGGPRKEFRLYLAEPLPDPKGCHSHEKHGSACEEKPEKAKPQAHQRAKHVSVSSSGKAVALLANDPGGLAAVDFSVLGSGGVKFLAVDGASPSLESISSAKYPLSKTLYLVVPGGQDGPSAEAVRYIGSEAFERRLLAESCMPLDGRRAAAKPNGGEGRK